MTLREVLAAMGKMTGPSPSLYGYFASESIPMPSSQVLSVKERRELYNLAVAAGPKRKECFYNAQQLALRHPDLFTYAEGFVAAGLGIPIHHGWCVTRDGLTIVDPTLRIDHKKRLSPTNIVLGNIPPGWEYVGRLFTPEEITRRWRTGIAGSLVDDPYNDWPLLKRKEVRGKESA